MSAEAKTAVFEDSPITWADVRWYQDIDLDELPGPLSPEFDCGIEWRDSHGNLRRTVKHWEGRRKVIAEITSFAGISIGAIHYYVRLHWYQAHIWEEEDGQLHNMGGYIDGLPDGTPWKTCSVRVTRVLTEQEIADDPHRWEGYDPGDMVDAFCSPEAASKAAREAAAKYFPHWELDESDLVENP